MTTEAFFQQLTAQSRGVQPDFEKSRFENEQENALDLARQKYQYNYAYLPPLALLDTLPPEEEFPEDWLRMLLFHGVQLLLNTLIVNKGDRGQAGLSDDIRRFLIEALIKQPLSIRKTVLMMMTSFIEELSHRSLLESVKELDEMAVGVVEKIGKARVKQIVGAAAEILLQGRPLGRPLAVKDYYQLYQELDVPAIASGFQDDDIFAYLRIAGPNPGMLQQAEAVEGRLPIDNFLVTEAQYQSVMGTHDSIQLASEERRLYVIDYAVFENAVNGSFPAEQKYVGAPIALFAVPMGDDANRQLKVVAIQCEQTPGPDNPVLTPPAPDASEAEQYQWLFAKSVFQISDSNYHEAVSHLGRTHLMVEPFVMATHRQLLDTHPLSLLLRPHFEGTLAINNAAHSRLISPGGGVDQLLGSTIDNDRVFTALGLLSTGFNDAMLPNQIKQNGVDDTAAFPVYPYRDDALMIWAAIHEWVTAYLGLYYGSDSDVQQDVALQDWTKEIADPEGGRLRGFGEGETSEGVSDGTIRSLAYLADVATMVIFTSSAQHAAVNFPQYELMGYAPGSPLAGYNPNAKVTSIQNEQDFLSFLPPLDQAQNQLNLLYLLSSVNYTKLGYYPDDHFTDEQVDTPLWQFQAKLEEIETTISASNLKRSPYEFLLPSRIPQSINI